MTVKGDDVYLVCIYWAFYQGFLDLHQLDPLVHQRVIRRSHHHVFCASRDLGDTLQTTKVYTPTNTVNPNF